MGKGSRQVKNYGINNQDPEHQMQARDTNQAITPTSIFVISNPFFITEPGKCFI